VNILLGITGGIAAFKAAEFVRLLTQRGHRVRCVLTQAATSFVAPLTLEILTGDRVLREDYLSPAGSSRFSPDNVTTESGALTAGRGSRGDRQSGSEEHIALAAWADLYCVAPATAHTISRLALGLADDFLTTTALAFSGPFVVAPAMHSTMWEQAAVQENVTRLLKRGVLFVGPVEGPLASGESGIGRMAEPAEILSVLESTIEEETLNGKRVVISAGPTRENLDPVRFLSNRSSGRMGFALATEAARRGAQIALVAGPVALETPAGVERVNVTTAEEMRAQVEIRAASADVIVMAAAVSDFRPKQFNKSKIKKADGLPIIELEPNPDILSGLATTAPDALRIGFAAETDDLEGNAAAKLKAKHAHMIVANDVSRSDIGFDSPDNEVTVFSGEGQPVRLGRGSKIELAAKLWDIFSRELASRDNKALTATS
jgi:phosphopantothenoylcysteine decarboxylase/phosphopantothenate--cysteine ligase